jgi:MATE family multidrug resistance protein
MPTPPRAIASSPNTRNTIARSPFSSSYLSASPLAQESIQRDIEEGSEDDVGVIESDDEGSSSDDESEASTVRPSDGQRQGQSMASSYRRPSFVAFGGPRASVTPHPEVNYATKKEKKQARNEQQSLLRDNHLAPPKHPKKPGEPSTATKIYNRLFSTKLPKKQDDEEEGQAPLFTAEPSETSALLGNGIAESARDGHERRNKIWEAAVKSGKCEYQRWAYVR